MEKSILGVIDLETRQWVAEETPTYDHYLSTAMVPGNGGKQLVVTTSGFAGTCMEVWELDIRSGADNEPEHKCTDVFCSNNVCGWWQQCHAPGPCWQGARSLSCGLIWQGNAQWEHGLVSHLLVMKCTVLLCVLEAGFSNPFVLCVNLGPADRQGG